MKISILLYLGPNGDNHGLASALTKAGIQVRSVTSLSALHNRAGSVFYNAILVNRLLLHLHDLTPARHLWEFRSPHCILVYFERADGTLGTDFSSLPQDIRGISVDPNREEIIERIRAVCNAVNSPDNRNIQCEEGIQQQNLQHTDTLLPADFELHLQKKSRLILEILEKAGKSGMNTEGITSRVWTSGEDKKKDIQIYICKLRKKLENSFGSQYCIIFRKSRYYLQENRTGTD